MIHEELIESFDERRDIVIPGNEKETIQFSVEHFLKKANKAINQQGYFAVALSGGTTPKFIYQKLAETSAKVIDWRRVLLFWGDERSVSHNHPDSNYHMAMEAGFKNLPLKSENIFPMPVMGDLEKEARDYEDLIKTKIPSGKFDLVMLGMGDDGHTASLFPATHGLHALNRLVVANYIPQKNTWRMTLTFNCINEADLACFYILGANKANMVEKVLMGPFTPDFLPAQGVGTSAHKALWILDKESSSLL
jgi:6-phosphogluconolactonase